MASVTGLPFVAARAEATVLFEDEFKYTGWMTGPDPMRTKWKKVTGRDPEFLISDNEADPSSIKLGNNVFYFELEKPLAGSFTLSAEALFTTYSRSLWFGLSREDGSTGRSAVWGAALETQYGGEGWVQIRAVEADPASKNDAGWDINSFSTGLGPKPLISGHDGGALSPPFAKIDLHWDADAGRWSLFVDGKFVTGASDDSFDFGTSPRVYFGGGTGVLFKRISLIEGSLSQ